MSAGWNTQCFFPSFEFFASSVGKDSRPGVLSLADNDGISVSCGLFRQSRRVRSADHDRHTAAP
jgi:hypothetical protein